MEYEIRVEPVVQQISNTNSTQLRTITTGGSTITSDWDWKPTFQYTLPYYTTIYMYQLICPRCKTTNWGQVNTPVTCKGIWKQERRPNGATTYCKAVLKAVTQQVDFEIPVK